MYLYHTYVHTSTGWELPQVARREPQTLQIMFSIQLVCYIACAPFHLIVLIIINSANNQQITTEGF